MKTSVLEIHDMLSVLSVDDVERRIGEVPGVDSVTVNFAAGTATVRYDETRLEIAGIRSAVRQRGYEATAPAAASADDSHEGHTAPSGPPPTPAPAATKTASVAPVAAPAPTSAAPKSAPDADAVAPAPAADEQQHKAAPDKG